MNIFHLFLFLIILFVGIVTTYTDIKFYKIRNKWILFGLISGVVIYIFNFIFNYDKISWSDFLYMFLNLLIVLIVGISMWIYEIWNPGDAKLYFLFAFLSPISIYQNGVVKYYPAITILLNSFLFVILFVIFEFIRDFKKKKRNDLFDKIFKIDNTTYAVFLAFFMMGWILELIFGYIFKISVPMIIIVIISFLIQNIFKYIITKVWYSIFFFIALRMIFDENLYTIYFFYDLFRFVIYYLLFFIIFSEIPKRFFSKCIKMKDLKEGMILKDNIYLKQTDEEKKQKVKETIILRKSTSGLKKEDILLLKKNLKKDLIVEDFEVVEHTYFAPFLFLGVVLTYLLKGSLIYLIKHFFI